MSVCLYCECVLVHMLASSRYLLQTCQRRADKHVSVIVRERFCACSACTSRRTQTRSHCAPGLCDALPSLHMLRDGCELQQEWEVPRTVSALLADLEEDEEDIAEAELRREREAAKLNAASKQAGGGQADGLLVLKVQCHAGHVHIRQKPDGNFMELMQKFKAHAEKQGWASPGQRLALKFDGDDIDPEGSSPEELDIENEEVLDVTIT